MFFSGKIPALVLLLALSLSSIAACGSTPQRQQAGRTDVRKEKGPLLLRPAIAIIRRHREIGTHLDGPRCPMYPSCAAYAEKAVKRFSLLGLMMAVDRLFFREAGGLDRKYLFAPSSKSSHLRFFDPVEDSLPLGQDRRPSLLHEEYRPLPLD